MKNMIKKNSLFSLKKRVSIYLSTCRHVNDSFHENLHRNHFYSNGVSMNGVFSSFSYLKSFLSLSAVTPLFLVFVMVSGMMISCRGSDRPRKKRPVAVRTENVSVRTLRKTADYIGTVHSRREVSVLARIPGRVLELPFAEGDKVKKGEIVARLVAPELSAAYSKTQAEVAKVKAEKEHLCHWAEVHEGLEKKGAFSRSKAEASRRACVVAEASYRAALSAGRQMAAERGKSVERAPFDGIVLKRLVDPGENMMPGRPMLLIGREEKEIRAWVTESDIYSGISIGTPVLIGATGDPRRAEVTRIAPQARGPARLFEVAMDLQGKNMKTKRVFHRNGDKAEKKDEDKAESNAQHKAGSVARHKVKYDGKKSGAKTIAPAGRRNSSAGGFLHGSSVSVSFVLREDKGTAVPVRALLPRGEGTSDVFVIRNERAVRISVKEIMRDESWARVSGEIKSGDHVAVSNITSLKDGVAVFPVSRIGVE